MRAVRGGLLALGLVLSAGCASSGHDAAAGSRKDAASGDDRFAGRTYAGDATRGKLVFATNCATCHGADGRPGGVGPSLIAESARQDLARTIVWIENPDPPMPKLYPSPLSDEDVADVATFVQTIK